MISAGLAGHLSSCTSLHWFSCTFPSHTPLLPSSNKLPGSIPCWRNRVSLFPGAALQDLSRKHQECRRGKPRERRTRNSKRGLAEPWHSPRGGGASSCGAGSLLQEGKEVGSFLSPYQVHSLVISETESTHHEGLIFDHHRLLSSHVQSLGRASWFFL